MWMSTLTSMGKITFSQMTTDMFLCLITIRPFPYSYLIMGFVTGVTWRMSHVEQELLTLPEDMSSPTLVVFCRSLFVLLSFSFGHYIVCPSSIDVVQWLSNISNIYTPLVSSNFSSSYQFVYSRNNVSW
jgi:hypothetical protein